MMPRPEDLCTRHLQRIFITLLFNYQRSISLLKARKPANRGLQALQRLTTLPPDGGGERDRTDGLLRARQALSQLSYTPVTDVVGLGGLEPPTSRLSAVRSNQLSYRPVQRTEDGVTTFLVSGFPPSDEPSTVILNIERSSRSLKTE